MKSSIAVLAVLVLGIAMTVSGGFVLAQSSKVAQSSKPEAQPEMTAALNHLREAERDLETASHDKGGHRAKALEHVKQAISEVQQGIQYDNTHPDPNKK